MPSLHFLFHTLQLFNSGSFLPHKIFSSSLYLALPLLTQLITKSGFWIDPAYLELGCSPDGLIDDEDNQLKGVLEIKCPIVLKEITYATR
jgi:hypothetical protein